ncbi:hypothetical protein QYM36_008095 [Artemia franciscana]|uniref:HAT C-terminal dimerisation domain-containing protein n=1 Tax=Artemia franciscana TaxID=6661 RepID=A0AA88LDI2_ARTSF|nr:hypothetical protein QYM36_008095 [Artemia franciscana]
MDLGAVYGHVSNLLDVLAKRRETCDEEFALVFEQVKELSDKIQLAVKVPRTAQSKVHRNNSPHTTPEVYYRHVVFIPMLDSVIMEETAKECDRHLYPDVSSLFDIFISLPVSVASAKRSFSTLRKLKTWLREQMGQTRLSGLALLNVHRDIDIRIDRVIDRRELRSQENSLDRLPLLLNKSRDGSPLRPGEIPSVPLTILGDLLSPVAVMELNNKFSRGNPTHPPSKCSGPLRSKSVDRGYLRKERSERQTFFSSFLNNNNDEAGVEIPIVRVNEVYIPERGRARNRIDHKEGNFRTLEVPFVTPVSVTDNGNISHSTGKKSFIEQRIERLYGPGALARNYLTPVKAPKRSTVKSSSVSDTKEEKVENSMKGCATPPVFRHLRQKFLEKLPVKRTSPVKPVRKLFPPQETQSLPLTSEVDGTSIESKRQAAEILVKSLDVEASTVFTDFS